MDYTEIIIAILGLVGVIIPSYLFHKREINKHKLEIIEKEREIISLNQEKKQDKFKLDFFNRAMDLSRINPIIKGVNKIFDKTKSDRFLILIAINGKTNFNIVSVIFEQHKTNEYQTNAIGTYKNIEIDDMYRNMLKTTEALGTVDLNVVKMPDSLLKDFYDYEGVSYSKLRFLGRQSIDADNDFVIYSSLATHLNKPFTKRENTLIKTIYESTIIPNISTVLN